MDFSIRDLEHNFVIAPMNHDFSKKFYEKYYKNSITVQEFKEIYLNEFYSEGIKYASHPDKLTLGVMSKMAFTTAAGMNYFNNYKDAEEDFINGCVKNGMTNSEVINLINILKCNSNDK